MFAMAFSRPRLQAPLKPGTYRQEQAIGALEQRRKRPALELAADPGEAGQRRPKIGKSTTPARVPSVGVHHMESPKRIFTQQARGDLGGR